VGVVGSRRPPQALLQGQHDRIVGIDSDQRPPDGLDVHHHLVLVIQGSDEPPNGVAIKKVWYHARGVLDGSLCLVAALGLLEAAQGHRGLPSRFRRAVASTRGNPVDVAAESLAILSKAPFYRGRRYQTLFAPRGSTDQLPDRLN
jgi:hypothetical protein